LRFAADGTKHNRVIDEHLIPSVTGSRKIQKLYRVRRLVYFGLPISDCFRSRSSGDIGRGKIENVL